MEGDRCEFGIGTDRADCHELRHGVEPRLLHHLDPHDRVFIEEASGIGPIGTDAADPRGEVDDNLGLRVRVHTNHLGLLRQVVVAATESDDAGVSLILDQLDEPAAQEASAARHHDALPMPPGRFNCPDSAAFTDSSSGSRVEPGTMARGHAICNVD